MSLTKRYDRQICNLIGLKTYMVLSYLFPENFQILNEPNVVNKYNLELVENVISEYSLTGEQIKEELIDSILNNKISPRISLLCSSSPPPDYYCSSFIENIIFILWIMIFIIIFFSMIFKFVPKCKFNNFT